MIKNIKAGIKGLPSVSSYFSMFATTAQAQMERITPGQMRTFQGLNPLLDNCLSSSSWCNMVLLGGRDGSVLAGLALHPSSASLPASSHVFPLSRQVVPGDFSHRRGSGAGRVSNRANFQEQPLQ